MRDQYMMKLCMNDNSRCYMASIMVASVKTYDLGCLEKRKVRESFAYCIIYIIKLEEL